ncbi:MAG: hypothetical protein SCALA701_28840 [Candidatus Scalindua sp.]|nr:MAG: hypothetical protein SCALA701_28840 [Candidatus Scalindua sp.]
MLVDRLLDQGFQNLTVLDISSKAIHYAQERLGSRAENVSWIEADVTEFEPSDQYDLWHDRGVFHFLTDTKDKTQYMRRLEEAVKPGGHVIIAAFAIDGPTKCSGLDIERYSPEKKKNAFGDSKAVIFLLTILLFMLNVLLESIFPVYHTFFASYMFSKTIKSRYYATLILFAFCLSSATLSSSLLYGSEAHFHQDNVHIHHTDKDHGLGESDHEDADIILYLDYIVVNSANLVIIFSYLNSYLHSHNSPDYFYHLSNSFSGVLQYSYMCSSCAHNLYQQKSSYLI